jgi:hypothetical protein
MLSIEKSITLNFGQTEMSKCCNLASILFVLHVSLRNKTRDEGVYPILLHRHILKDGISGCMAERSRDDRLQLS